MVRGSFEYEMLTLKYLAEKYDTLFDPYYRTFVYNCSSHKMYFHRNINKQWKISLNGNKPWISTMTIYCPDIDDESMIWHANALYFDPSTKKIYRFEPHGSKAHYDQKYIDRAFEKFVSRYGLEYVKPKAYCDTPGPQQYEKVKGLGYCQSWAFLFLEYVLSKKSIPENFCINLLKSKKNIPKIIQEYYNNKQVKYVKTIRATYPEHTRKIRELQNTDIDTFNYIYL